MGQAVDASPAHRHRCEVRMLLRANQDPARGNGWVRGYLNDARVSGRRAALLCDLKAQQARGNTGEEGAWL
ncbi:MAG: hypothetical protein J7556_22155 [Acidovorax sp.]|nr:hypothetical protein [Acidovorax sp.]